MNEDGIKITGGTFPTVAGKNWTSPMDCDPQDGALVEYEFVGRNGPVIRSGWWNASTRCFIADAPYDNTDSRGARGVTCWRVRAPKEEAEIAFIGANEDCSTLRAESDRLGYKLDAAERRIAQLEAERSEPDPGLPLVMQYDNHEGNVIYRGAERYFYLGHLSATASERAFELIRCYNIQHGEEREEALFDRTLKRGEAAQARPERCGTRRVR